MPEERSAIPAPAPEERSARRNGFLGIPGALWGLIALAVGLILGIYFPERLAFIGSGVLSVLGAIAWAAPYIIFFTMAAAIGGMLKTGSAARFALWVSVTFVITTVVAGLWAVAVLWPIFRLPLGVEAGTGWETLGGVLANIGTTARSSPLFIAIVWAILCGIGLHYGARRRGIGWIAGPTQDVIHRVGVDVVGAIGRGMRTLLPAILFAIGVFIPTGAAEAIAKSQAGMEEAGAMGAFADASPVTWYFISLGITVFILMSFLLVASFAVCRYTRFPWSRFIKDYLLYVYPFAWATASSVTTIPINLERAESGLKVRKEVRDFIIPLGATVNLDGTMMAAFVFTVVAGTLVGYTPSVLDLLILIIPLTIVTVGAPGIPGGMAIIAPPIIAAFLPLDAAMVAAFIPIWIGFSLGLSDQFRTGVNSADNGLISLLYEHWYDSKFAREVPVLDSSGPAGAASSPLDAEVPAPGVKRE